MTEEAQLSALKANIERFTHPNELDKLSEPRYAYGQAPTFFGVSDGKNKYASCHKVSTLFQIILYLNCIK